MSRVPYSSNDYIGSANAAVLSGSITSTSSVISISGTTASWDSLGSTGGFVVAINYGTAIEEKVYIPSGSYAWGSPVVTISGVQRGYDNTTAAGQSDGFSVVHVLTATDLQEANKVVAGLLGNGSPLTVNPLTVSGSLTVSGAVSLNTPLGITDGGTGASSAASALSNLGALPLSGGTMTGALTLASDPSTALEAATKEYADTKLPLAGGTMTGALTLASAPSSSLQAATKSYVDATAQGLSIKQSCQEATTAALPANTYAAGVITITSTGILTVDGVTVALNDRVLVKNEAAAANNGIYLCTTAGATGVSAVLTRATDSNTSADIVGAFTFIENGTVNASSGWVNTNTGTITIGTTSITYTQFSGAGEITAGTGLTKSGNTLAIGSVITAGSVGSSSSIPVLNYNAEGQITGVSSANPNDTSKMAISTYDPAAIDQQVLGISATQTITNKRITKRIIAYSANATTYSINTDSYDVAHITAQTATITSIATTGTPVDGDTLRISITGTAAVPFTLSSTNFESSTVSLSTTTAGTARLDMGFFWNSETSKWRQVAVA